MTSYLFKYISKTLFFVQLKQKSKLQEESAGLNVSSEQTSILCVETFDD